MATKSRATPWLLLAPALILLVVLVLVPYCGALFYAFTDATLTRIIDVNLIGTANFEQLVESRLPPFPTLITTTIVFGVGTAIGTLFLGTTLAMILHTLSSNWRAALLAVLLIPYVMAGVIIGYTWRLIYDPQAGLINTVLGMFGVGGVDWLTERGLSILSLVVANVWAGSGLVLLVISAALSNMPRNIVLAAQVDGAGLGRILRRIVIPNIMPAFLLATLIALIGGLNVFDLIFVMTHGGPIYQTETLALTMYRLTFQQGEVGQGASLTVLLFIFSIALATLYVMGWQREARRWK